MWYQGCRSCKNRIGKDHQDADRCSECPAKIKKRKNPGSKKNQGKNQKGHSEHASNRPQRSERVHNYAEPPDDPMNEDSEEAPDNDSGDMQEGYLCTSADPRRVGVGEGNDSQPQGSVADPYTPTDHRRSNDMDDISPDRIPG